MPLRVCALYFKNQPRNPNEEEKRAICQVIAAGAFGNDFSLPAISRSRDRSVLCIYYSCVCVYYKSRTHQNASVYPGIIALTSQSIIHK